MFNIGEAFRTIHDMTVPGGLSLHTVPGFAFINHGFYNIHPNLFVEMARANGYEIVDFRYFDNVFVRNLRLAKGVRNFDLDSLPIRLSDMENTQTFMNRVVDLFYRNLVSPETRRVIAGLDPNTRKLPAGEYPSAKFHICFVFDLIVLCVAQTNEPQAVCHADSKSLRRGSLGEAVRRASVGSCANVGPILRRGRFWRDIAP